MTDHRDPAEPSEPEPGATRPGVDDSASPVDRSPFDEAFAGPAWNSGPRRRRSSSQSSSGRRRSQESRRRSGSRERRPSAEPAARSSRPRSSGRGRHARHVRAVVVHVVLGLLGVGLAWIVVTGALAAWQLQSARSDLTALREGVTSGDTGGLSTTARSLADHAHHAEVLTRGPAWALAARVPYIGEPMAVVRGITEQTSSLVDTAAPGLVAVAGDVNPRSVVRGDSIDLDAVQRAGPAVTTAATAADAARAGLEALPTSTWLPPVDHATTELQRQLTDLAGTLGTADRTLQVLPTMLGQGGQTRRYFVAFQNNAELRGTGGLPGAFAIVAATNGKVSIERFEPDSTLGLVIPTNLDFGKGFNRHYAGEDAYTQYVDSNASPHFPYAAQIWCAMWTQVTGQQLDGALTVDPAALSYLLEATGPATAPDGERVSADNVVALLQKDAYDKFPDQGENQNRKDYILAIAEAAEKKVLAGTNNPRALLQGLARGVAERRIVVWDRDPAVQTVLGASRIGGTIPATSEPFGMLSLNNGAGGKLDYYLKRSVSVVRSGCGATRDVTVTIKLTNGAPASGLPPYVVDRINVAEPPGFVPGQNRTVVDWVATEGAQLVSATLDGQTSGAGVFDEVGHPSYETILEIKPGETRTWVLHLQEPAATQPVTILDQPGVLPIETAVDDRSCR